MTPDLPIPEEAVEAVARHVYFAKRGVHWNFIWADEAKRAQAQQEAREAAVAALGDALPHLRSLQVETQVRIGRELGRAEAWEEIADAVSLGEDWQVEDPRISYVDVQVDKDMYLKLEEIRANRASRAAEPGSDGLTASPGTSGHPQDSQTAREAL